MKGNSAHEKRFVYLDHSATTPVDPEVLSSMNDVLRNVYGNPSSIHREGRLARKILDDAREEMATFLNCMPNEIVFTGSGSESNNLAIKGIFERSGHASPHIISSRVEHPSVLNTVRHLEKSGCSVTYLDVADDGRLVLDDIKAAIREETVLISIMMANNETGVVFPVKEIAALARENNIVFHADAVQAAGKVYLDVRELGVDLLSIAGHKFYGPKGAGALYVRDGVQFEALVHGGGQELGRRGGTEDIGGIVGIAAAARIARATLSIEAVRVKKFRLMLKEGIRASIKNAVFNADHEEILPNTLSVSFKGVSAESLVMALDLEGFALSAGSACSSGSISPSHVLAAMGLGDETINSTVRISLGRWTTREDIDAFLKILPPAIDRLSS